MQNILAVVGTRPEAIKMAPLIKRIQKTGGLSVSICSTGQHREMISQVFDLFGLVPDIDLGVMQPNQHLGDLTCRLISGLEGVVGVNRPDRILVHGDTSTTMAASLVGYYHKIPVEHVEAGLRTGNIHAPWPEEVNRRIADIIAETLYAPTSGARDNLLRENVPAEKIRVTGNTVIDALFDILNGPLAEAQTVSSLERKFPFLQAKSKIILVTCHRRESFGTGLANVCASLRTLAARDDVTIIFPIHLNPNIRQAFAGLSNLSNVHLIEPLNYLEFVFLMSRCYFTLTDSGGIQEEAPSLGKPVLVLREVTERPEALAAGTVRLVGTNPDAIVGQSKSLLDNVDAYRTMSGAHNPYGDGKASARIIANLKGEKSDAFHV